MVENSISFDMIKLWSEWYWKSIIDKKKLFATYKCAHYLFINSIGLSVIWEKINVWWAHWII